jgi:hypothetical protein
VEAFIGAYLAGDDAAGLVFLDWVEERGLFDEVVRELDARMDLLVWLGDGALHPHWGRLERLHWGVTIRSHGMPVASL